MSDFNDIVDENNKKATLSTTTTMGSMTMLSSELLEMADKFKSIVKIKNRRYRFKTYKQCFVGRGKSSIMAAVIC